MKNKQLWPDHLRAIATIGVIMIHVSSPVLHKFKEITLNSWTVGNFYDSAARCCVPIFFMLSGALLLGKDYTLKDFIRKRLTRIIPPFIFWSIIYILYDIFTTGISFSSYIEMGQYFILKLFNGSQFHLWFVYTLLGLYLFVPILTKWIKYSSKNDILYFLIIWAFTLIAGLGLPFLKNFLPNIYLVNFSGFLGYMVLGYYLSTLKPIKKYISLLLFGFGVITTLIGTYFLTVKTSALNEFFYGYLTPNVLISSIGAFLFIKELKFKSKFITNALSYVSRYSYGIYLVHALVLSLLYKVGISSEFFNPIISIPAITIVILLFSGLIIYFGKKLKFMSHLVD